MTNPIKPGAVLLPPGAIANSIRTQVEKFAATLPADDPSVLGVEIGIDLPTGVNAAIAYRRQDPNGRWMWMAGTYVGKQWDMPADWDAGVFVKGWIKL